MSGEQLRPTPAEVEAFRLGMAEKERQNERFLAEFAASYRRQALLSFVVGTIFGQLAGLVGGWLAAWWFFMR